MRCFEVHRDGLMKVPERRQLTEGLSMTECTVYVDADNQTAALSGLLLDALARRGLRAASIHVFGNARGPHLAQWRRGLAAADTRLPVHTTQVPCHSQAADVALLLALGGRLATHVSEAVPVVIVSRDNLLLACAQRLQVLGADVLVCHGPAPAAKWKVETMVLKPSEPSAEALRLLGRIRQAVPPEPSGGYRKSLVGAFLRSAGLDRSGRAAFLASVPGLRIARTDGDRLLFI